MLMLSGKFLFERAVLSGNFGMVPQVIAEKKLLPLRKIMLDHVDVMGSVSLCIAFDEPGIKWRRIVAGGGAPEVIVSPSGRHKMRSGFISMSPIGADSY